MSIEELSENQFKALGPLMEKWVNRNRFGRKVAPWRPVVNSIFWILRTGAPWQAVPRTPHFAPPFTTHQWLGKRSLLFGETAMGG